MKLKRLGLVLLAICAVALAVCVIALVSMAIDDATEVLSGMVVLADCLAVSA